MGKRGPRPKRREIVWTPELAYAIGLMASDGCLSSNGRHLDFTSKDKDQIRSLVSCLSLQHIKIGTKNKNQSNWAYRVQWGDVVLYQFFVNVGLTSKKSKTLGALAVPDKYFFDFLRGSFDGDGCFYSYFDPRWKSSFMYYLTFASASPAHIQWIQKTLTRLLRVRGHLSQHGGEGQKRGWMGSLRFAKKEALVVIRAMYSTSCSIHLSRKRLKIEKALRIVGESLPQTRRALTK